MTKEFRIGMISSSVVVSQKPYWKRILVVDDDTYSLTSFKFGIEYATKMGNKRIVVDAYNDPRKALLDFQPNLYDLLLNDINMPCMNGFRIPKERAV